MSAAIVDDYQSLNHILRSQTLKWIFVGGKGGVGKTTSSCCLAVQLSKVRRNVLLISTDPAHNLSDAFNQKFTKHPTPVQGFDNLHAMEIDPNLENNEEFLNNAGGEGNNFLKDIAQSIPGIDEAMSFAEMMKLVQNMQYDVVVFDTAPTGHTLRLLSFPSTLGRSMGKLFEIKNRFSGLFNQFGSMMGGGLDLNTMTDKFETMKAVIEEVNKQFKDPNLTTFVCVCIPEFLSLYETERLIQELAKYEIDTNTIIVNQVLFPDKGDNDYKFSYSFPSDAHCTLCASRQNIQKKYLDQMSDLYEDFHVIKCPLLGQEIRGTPKLTEFSSYLCGQPKQ
ncbi:Arsenite-Antimonite (ArsAB) Efflux Family [Planoprotostelium fungivorum]|uniref:ATPase ASNA1 homolog n=1 Tax=Planoprotostelium fungivorum TaxID=1890364 RepID=A0A2P6MXI8_9EUKA|nr:Arsenite-Antimonite (ArsAB) Efflux Family [Planoprotostelium fungivorum]